jgi:hypothetical protein
MRRLMADLGGFWCEYVEAMNFKMFLGYSQRIC